MTTATEKKLIRVTTGLYRSASGNLIITDNKILRNPRGRWSAQWTNVWGGKEIRWFHSFAEAREYFANNH